MKNPPALSWRGVHLPPDKNATSNSHWYGGLYHRRGTSQFLVATIEVLEIPWCALDFDAIIRLVDIQPGLEFRGWSRGNPQAAIDAADAKARVFAKSVAWIGDGP